MVKSLTMSFQVSIQNLSSLLIQIYLGINTNSLENLEPSETNIAT